MSNRATPKLKELARRLHALEMEADVPGGVEASAAYRVCEKLRVPLGRLLGVDGFRLLLARALILTQAEIPDLQGVKIGPGGTPEGLGERAARLEPRATATGERAFIAHLVGLLVTFVGPALALRWLHDLWPTTNDLDL